PRSKRDSGVAQARRVRSESAEQTTSRRVQAVKASPLEEPSVPFINSLTTLPAAALSRARTTDKRDKGLKRYQARLRIRSRDCSRSLEGKEAQSCSALLHS